MADVYDRWHKSHPKPDDTECGEHKSRTRRLVPTADHGIGKRWQVRYRDLGGKQRKENFEIKAKADARATEIGAAIDQRSFIDPNAGKVTLREVAERWRKSAVHRGTTAERAERSLRLHIYPILGDRPIASIRTSDLQAWVKDRSQVLKPTTLEVTYSTLTAIFTSAMHDRSISFNPCGGVKLPAARKPEIVPLSVWAVAALVEGAPRWYRALLLLAAASGLRQGELFGLEVEHVNFRTGTVRVEQQIITPDKGDCYLGEPKTHESYREVPVAKAAMDALANHLERYPARWVEVEDRTDAHRPKIRKAQFVFLNERGTPVGRSGWSHMWQNLRHVANKALAEQYAARYARWDKRGRTDGEEPAPQRVPEDATMHDLRHFYASVLIKHRESVKTVQKRLGHAKPSITLDIYTHLWPDERDTTRAAVEAVLGDVPSLCPSAA